MSNKMLIDASHPEETRVAVVRGNRIEEFDFESQEKKQLRGNIYLAKVTRVEPSLQAAFIDYGGNRHGFLAFSEIHPDYYQIPVADRQALLEAEAEEARASREAEEAEDDESGDQEEPETAVSEAENEKPKNGRRRRRSKKQEASDVTADDSVSEDESASEISSEDDNSSEQLETATSESSNQTETSSEPVERPKRRTTRRKTKPKAEENTEDVSGGVSNSDDEEAPDGSGTIAAVVETDSISEPLPGEDEENTNQDEAETSADSDVPEEAISKPKKRAYTRRKKAAAKKEETDSEATPDNEEAPTQAVDSTASEQATSSEEENTEEEKKPARSRRRGKGKKTADEQQVQSKTLSDSNDPENSDDPEAQEAEDVESVGQEDALEEAIAPRRARKQYKIQEVIKRRQILLVQVVKEERGNKGAALTTYLSLAGRYSVLMPNTARGGGISRKITNSADRKRLKSIASELEVPDGMGVILRTAGAARTKVEITRDFQYLMRLWEQVRNLTLSSTAPCLVYEEGSLVKRSIRDLYDKDTGEIIVCGEKGYEEARDFMGMLMPSHVKKVKQYKDPQAIFAKYGVEAHLENMVSPQVTLKSGGYLVINQTEALVAVDVNSGRSTREHSIENTALQTNLEAAEEVARQLRLRDLAGLIVIDFIDMEERRNNRAVEKKLKDCLKNDRARIQVGRISHFGLLEMSRQRIRASVLESTMDVCPHCAGVGYIRSESAVALHIFRALEEHVSRNRKWNATLRTTPEIAVHMLNYKRAALVELEQKFGVQIMVLADHNLNGQQFEIDKGERATVTSDQSAVGYNGDNYSDQTDAAESDDDDSENRGRKRNRRRNKRNRNDDVELTETETSEEEATQEISSEQDTEDDGPRKKRRRGKRGGKKRKETDSEVESDAPADESSDDFEGAEKTTPKEEEMVVEGSDSAEEEKPVRRSTRRKKAPISASSDVEAIQASPDAESSQESDEVSRVEPEAPRPKRRTTRRKSVETAEEDQTTEQAASVSESADNTVSEAVSGTDVGDEQSTQADSEKKPKRSGWWSRGGGFF